MPSRPPITTLARCLLPAVAALALLACAAGTARAQEYVGDEPRFEEIALALDELALTSPAVTRGVDITLTGSLAQFAVVFSRETGLNLTVDPRLTQQVVANFKDTNPRDILLHLARFYDLDLAVNGSILSLVPHRRTPPAYRAPEPEIAFDAASGLVSFDLRGDTLDYVVKALTRLTGSNITATRRAGGLAVSGFARDLPLEAALEQLGTRNDLRVTYDRPGNFYVVDGGDAAEPGAGARPARRALLADGADAAPADGLVAVRVDSARGRLFTVRAEGVPLQDLVAAVAQAAGISHLMLEPAEAEVSYAVVDQALEPLLGNLLGVNGLGYRRQGGVYLVGPAEQALLRESQLVELMHRSVKDLLDVLPAEVQEGLEVREFLQLNALVVAGPAEAIAAFRAFVATIDREVPVVTIELLIVDVQRTAEVATGVEVGIAPEPVKPSGSVFPEVDLTLSSRSVNELLDLLAGNGVINLGQVTPDFYARVRAAENNGFAKVHSKPRLSTVNGQEATLSIGETRYYQVQRTTLAGNLNPVTLQDVNFESVNADFTIRILPVVAGGGGVTLEIEVDQSDFIGRLQSDAPPAQVSRTFSSMIRMNDGEMIVLGGLESKGVSDAGRGVPWLSRIPVLRFLFSSRQRSRDNSKLLVFVRPRVIY